MSTSPKSEIHRHVPATVFTPLSFSTYGPIDRPYAVGGIRKRQEATTQLPVCSHTGAGLSSSRAGCTLGS